MSPPKLLVAVVLMIESTSPLRHDDPLAPQLCFEQRAAHERSTFARWPRSWSNGSPAGW
jgi:hypothetical protein